MRKSIEAQRLYDDIFRKVMQKEWLPGTAIPSENDLAGLYGISRPTVRKMLGALCDNGLLEKRIGRGTFVCFPGEEVSDVPDRAFAVGIDICNASCFYISDIMQCLSTLPYREHVYLNFMDQESAGRGEIPAQLEGMLVIHDRMSDKAYQSFASANIPVVHFNHAYDIPGTGYVTVDHTVEAERAVSNMLRAGLKRVALIGQGDSFGSFSNYRRSLGWENACRKFLGEVPEDLIISFKRNHQGGYMAELLKAEPDSFFFVNMAQYSRFLWEYRNLTGNSGDDLTVLVFDDVDKDVSGVRHNVNFVRMPLMSMLKKAIEYLWQKKMKPGTPDLHEMFPCDLIIRRDWQQ